VTARGQTTTTHRGIQWRRDERGRIAFFDADGGQWVTWGPKVDAPPLPPGWEPKGGLPRAGWRSHWRLIPLALTLVVVAIAVAQGLRSGSGGANAAAKEAAASAALFGKCLAQDGRVSGLPKYKASPVPCTSTSAAVKVVRVLPPGSPLCPSGTVGVVLPYAGVTNPHVECVAPVYHG
jgi:hypothetical protein